MKSALNQWIQESALYKPATLFKMLKALHSRGRFGEVPCPTQKQVQSAVDYIRSKDHRLKSTVSAAIKELTKWQLDDNVIEQDEDKPFVFGVDMEDGKFVLGDGGIKSFRVGTLQVASNLYPLASSCRPVNCWPLAQVPTSCH